MNRAEFIIRYKVNKRHIVLHSNGRAGTASIGYYVGENGMIQFQKNEAIIQKSYQMDCGSEY